MPCRLNLKSLDSEVWFHVDSQYANLPKDANDGYRPGDLLAEIVFATTVYQQDTVPACQNYTNHIPVFKASQNITVTRS